MYIFHWKRGEKKADSGTIALIRTVLHYDFISPYLLETDFPLPDSRALYKIKKTQKTRVKRSDLRWAASGCRTSPSLFRCIPPLPRLFSEFTSRWRGPTFRRVSGCSVEKTKAAHFFQNKLTKKGGLLSFSSLSSKAARLLPNLDAKGLTLAAAAYVGRPSCWRARNELKRANLF